MGPHLNTFDHAKKTGNEQVLDVGGSVGQKGEVNADLLASIMLHAC